MLNFIIYEDEKKYREKYISIILKIVVSMKIAYRIIEIEKLRQYFSEDLQPDFIRILEILNIKEQ